MATEEEDFDWDDEDFDPEKGFVKNNEWEEEDKDLKESEILKEPPPTSKDQSDVPKKSKLERIEEKKAKRRAEDLKLSNDEASATDQLAEKLRLQKVQEDSDLEVAKELFGVSGSVASIDRMNPKNEEEFDSFRELLKNKLETLEPSILYVGFLDNLLRDLSVTLDVENIRRLSNTLAHLASEKQKTAKGTKTTKKKRGPKVSLAVGKASKKVVHDDFGDDMGAEFDDFI